MSEDLNNQSVKNIPFSGKRADYEKWSKRFLAYAQMKKVKQIILGLEEAPRHDTELDPDDEEDRALLKLRQANDTAYKKLMLAVDDVVSFETVSSARTEELPDGDAHLAWKKLEQVYAKKSTSKKSDLKAEFLKTKLPSATSDPDAWFTKLELIIAKLKIDYHYIIDEDDYIEHILVSLPEEYDATVESINRDIDAEREMDLDTIKEQIRARHSRICKHQGIDPQANEEEDEKALTAKFGKKFKGMCNVCGKMGHKGADCWESEKNKHKRPHYWKPRNNEGYNDKSKHGNNADEDAEAETSLFCTYCKKRGHLKEDCQKLAKKQQRKDEENSESAEVVMMGICEEDHSIKSKEDDYPVDDDFFDHFTQKSGDMADKAEKIALETSQLPSKFKNSTWLCDSAATCHMSCSSEGMTDLVESVKKIIMGNGKEMYSTHIGTFNGIVI